MKGKDGPVGDVGFPGNKGEDGKAGISGDVGLPGSLGTMTHDNFILKIFRSVSRLLLNFCLFFILRTPRSCRHERKSRASRFSRPLRGNWAPGSPWPNRNQRYVYYGVAVGKRVLSSKKDSNYFLLGDPSWG